MESDVCDPAVAAIRATAGTCTQRILLFGSYARGAQTVSSDLDILLVVEPRRGGRWTPADNLALRHRIRASLAIMSPRVDLWVRTTAQYADASRVYGGVEYWARLAAVCRYERPMTLRFVLPASTIPARDRLIRESLGEAQHHLRRARSQIALQERQSRRGVSCAALATLTYYGMDLHHKDDSVDVMISKIEQCSAGLAASLRSLIGMAPLSLDVATDMVACIGAHLESKLSSGTDRH